MTIPTQIYSEKLEFQLGGSQDLMNNACGINGFSLNLRQQQQQQKNQILSDQNSLKSIINANPLQSTVFSQGISAELERQKHEIDALIKMQSERLKLGLFHHRKQQIQSILKKYGREILSLLNEKDEEIAKSVKRRREVEDSLRRMEIQSQAWQRVAKENEATVVFLNNAIQQLKEKACFPADEAESCCQNWGDGKEEENQSGILICKICNSGNSCVALLPCRHLCSCKGCAILLDSCPVCGMVKKGSIVVFF